MDQLLQEGTKQRYSSQVYKKEAYWESLIQSIIGVCHIFCNVMSRSSSKCFNSLLKLFFISVTRFSVSTLRVLLSIEAYAWKYPLSFMVLVSLVTIRWITNLLKDRNTVLLSLSTFLDRSSREIDSGCILIKNSNISKSRGERSNKYTRRSFTVELRRVTGITDEWTEVLIVTSLLMMNYCGCIYKYWVIDTVYYWMDLPVLRKAINTAYF